MASPYYRRRAIGEVIQIETLILLLWGKADKPGYSFVLSCFVLHFYKAEEVHYNLGIMTSF